MSEETGWLAAMSSLGRHLPGRDLDCYRTFGRDADEPLPGGGPTSARVCMFGRDPGRDEVRHGIPFVGVGGQKIRAGLHEIFGGAQALTQESSIAVGRFTYWANTVPYKPLRNKAWSPRVVRLFKPPMTSFLLDLWQGKDLLTFGEVALFWFGIDHPQNRERVIAHWARHDRFETSVELSLVHPTTGAQRGVSVHPLPHPSPLNATWAAHFPSLLRNRLDQLRLSPSSWQTVST